MPARMRMFAGMAIRRAIATKRQATLLTRAQMNPLRADLYALSAFELVGEFD